VAHAASVREQLKLIDIIASAEPPRAGLNEKFIHRGMCMTRDGFMIGVA
jgi:hypothetical protein